VEANEAQTAVLQQRCLRVRRDMSAGSKLAASDLEALRPAPAGAARPYELARFIGREVNRPLVAGDAIAFNDLAPAAPSPVETVARLAPC
jgi:N-acetylneuraminate synthase